MEIRDQYHDPSFSFLYHILNENPEAQAFVKSASLDDGDALPDTAFAWPSRRLFPIDNAQSTVLSSLYREKCAAVPVEVDAMLEKAQSLYDVKGLLARCKTAAAAVPPVADSPDDYLLPAQSRLRVKTAEHLKAAEKLLLRDYPRLNLEDRATAFTNLVKKSQDLGVPLDPTSMRMAGMTQCTTKIAHDWIEARAAATKEPLFQSAYEKLASAFRGRGEFLQDRDELVAAVSALANLDKRAGLEQHYDKRLPDPIRTVFNTNKVAEETMDIAGAQIPLSELEALPATFWGDIVGEDIAAEFAGKTGPELRTVINTLPLDLKLILKNQVP